MTSAPSDPPVQPPPEQVSALAASLRVVTGRLSRRLRDQASLHDLTWTQISVLFQLERQGQATVTTLARLEGMRPQSMGANISVLEAAGLVSGRPDPGDGRQTILSITENCKQWIKTMRAAREDWLHNMIQTRLDPAEQAQLEAAIALLNRLVSDGEYPP